MKPDEVQMVLRLYAAARSDSTGYFPGIAAVEACIAEIPVPAKRAYCILDKWTDRGRWDYGVSVRGGWFTPDGLDWARVIVEHPSPAATPARCR